MRIGIAGSVGIPAQYGGYETLVENLSKFVPKDVELYVFCSSIDITERYTDLKVNRVWIPFKANGIMGIVYDIYSIYRARRLGLDIVLLLGYGALPVVSFLNAFFKVKIVVNPDGLEWKRAKWNKGVKTYLKFAEKIAAHRYELVTDNEAIRDYYKAKYNKDSVVITYGGDHLNLTDKRVGDIPKRKYALNISRICPENNIEMIIKSFLNQKDYALVLLGVWESGYEKYIYDTYQSDQVMYWPPLFDDVVLKNTLRKNCTFYVHGHSAGGSSPGLIESLFFDVPIFSFDTPSNRETTKNLVYYFKSEGELEELLKLDYLAYKHDVELIDFRDSMYTWKEVAERYFTCLSR